MLLSATKELRPANTVFIILKRAADLIKEIAGGTISSEVIDFILKRYSRST